VRHVASAPLGAGAGPEVPGVRLVAERGWESALVVVVTIVFATNVIETLFSLGEGGFRYPPHVRLAFLITYAIFGALLVLAREPAWRLLLAAPLLVLVLAMPWISVLWSVDPRETLERGVALVGSSIFGAYLGWRFTLGRLVFLLAVGMSIALCLSLAFILLLPSVGIAQGGQWAGSWQGVHFHKNGLGWAASLTCILTGYAIADNRGRARLGFAGAFLVAALLLVGSNSTSALLSLAVMGGLALWARYLQLLPKQIPVLSLIVAFAALTIGIQVIGMDLIESVLAFFGKSSDLSSRVPLWSIVWSFIEQRFWLGYGYEAFWKPDSPAVRLVASKLYFVPFYSHNGLLETWLNGGLVLVVLVLVLILSVLTKSMMLFVRWRTLAVSSFPLVFCGYFLMTNFAESVILARNNLVWAIFVAVAVFVGKWVRVRAI
jgi:exopolysaccharide production protein ExoQ